MDKAEILGHIKRSRENMELEKCKRLYRGLGYTNETDFPGEYLFMLNPETMECVRLYYNGRIEEYQK